jgi:hypothetical protein
MTAAVVTAAVVTTAAMAAMRTPGHGAGGRKNGADGGEGQTGGESDVAKSSHDALLQAGLPEERFSPASPAFRLFRPERPGVAASRKKVQTFSRGGKKISR